MMKENINKLKEAFKKYNIDSREELQDNVLRYIGDRIRANKTEIEKIIEVNKSDVKIEDILNIVENEIKSEVKGYGKTIINNQGFMLSQVLVPIGIIAVEVYEPLEIIKYWIKGIKSRNAIAISSVEYNENSIEALVLIIIKEALKKYKIDDNLVMYLSFEECFYEHFDKVFYTYDKKGKTLEKPLIEEKSKDSTQDRKMYVYLEDEEFKAEAEKNENAEILTGNIDNIVDKVENAKCATIYTKNSQSAFNFINLADCKNVFVNTNVENAIGILESEDEFYKYKNLIIPVPKELLNPKKESVDKGEKNEELRIEETNVNGENKETTALVKYKENLLEKIKRRFKTFFEF